MKLSHVLVAKILVTALLWCIPLLISSRALFSMVGLPTPAPLVFARLLGAAYAALILAYWHGLAETRRGRVPIAVIRVGLLSNGLASLILVLHGIAGSWSSWPLRGQAFMWLSLLATSSITVLLAVTGLRTPQSPSARGSGCAESGFTRPSGLVQRS